MAKAAEIVGIDCGGSAARAISLVLGSRIEEMCHLRKRALDFGDPEGVHDIRVTSRRIRSALRDFAPYLRKSKLSASTRQLKEIANKLGAVRDYDVAIIALEQMQTTATTEIASGMQGLIDAQKARRDPARKELVQALSHKSITSLKRSFLQELKASDFQPANRETKTQETSGSRSSYRSFARSTLLKRLKELEKLSPGLYEPLRIKPLHDMRIAAKRLRYALELFACCWGEPVTVFSRQVALLQSSLGELHDCDLWIMHLGKRLSRIKTTGEQATPQDERDAMIWLLSHFTRLRTKHFRAALARWHEWETKDFGSRLTATLRT